MKYKYSIIIPTHNRPDFLNRNLNALSNIKNGEVIIIENNSSAENLERYSKIELNEFERMFHVEDDKFRLSSARNFGIDKAKGEYLFFLDDDDLITTDFVSFLENGKFCEDIYRLQYLRDDGFKAGIKFGKIVKKTTKLDEVQVSSYLIKRELFSQCNIRFKECFMEDNVFAADIWKTGKVQRVIRGMNSITYTTTNESMTRTSEKNSNKILKMKDTMQLLTSKEYSEMPEYCFKVFNEALKLAKKDQSKQSKKWLLSFWKSSKLNTARTLFSLPMYYKFVWLLYKITLVV